MRTGLPVLRTSSMTARHVALNLEIAISSMSLIGIRNLVKKWSIWTDARLPDHWRRTAPPVAKPAVLH